jgi:preprotein translocase subunit YajC
MKFSSSVFGTALIAAVAALGPQTVAAQSGTAAAAKTSLAVGAVVHDPQGGEVGRVISVAGDTIVVDTGTHRATLPRAAFATDAKGPTVNATKAQLDALVAASLQKADAALAAALVPGAQVHGKAGAVIGTITKVDGEQVIIDRAEGGPVSLNKSAFALGTSGLTISMTASELAAAAGTAPSS